LRLGGERHGEQAERQDDYEDSRTDPRECSAHRRFTALSGERRRSTAGREHRERSVRWSAWFGAGPR
jgi:hypothetical protein